MKMKIAQLIAEAVSVICPACGECLSNKRGSEMWVPEDFDNLDGNVQKCSSCDVNLFISHSNKVQFPL